MYLKNLTAAPPLLQQMLMHLQGYDLHIKYRPGKELFLADGLSRLPSLKLDEIELGTNICFVQFSPRKLSTLQEETWKDVTLSTVQEMVTTGWPGRRQEVPKPLRPYWGIRNELSVKHGLVTKGDGILIPTSMRQVILSGIHAGHQGSEKCKLHARTCMNWPLMNNDIEELVSKCSTCQTHCKSHQPETLIPHEVPPQPWEVLGSDILTLHVYDYLLVWDYYSKFPIVRRVPTGQSNSPTIVKFLKQVSEYGIPERLISDKGLVYDCEIFRNFTRTWNIEHITSSPRYPQPTGSLSASWIPWRRPW